MPFTRRARIIWPLAMARPLDDAILMLRTNNPEVGTFLVRTEGEAVQCECDGALERFADDWFVREVIGFLRRTLSRLDVSSRSLFALIEEGACFAGTLFELALAADRSYMQPLKKTGRHRRVLSRMVRWLRNGARKDQACHGSTTTENGWRRWTIGTASLVAEEALDLGLVLSPDELDWDDEVRIAVESA